MPPFPFALAMKALPAIGTGLFQGIFGSKQREQARQMQQQANALEEGLMQQYQNLAAQGMSGAEYGKAQQNISNLIGTGLYQAQSLGRGMAQGLIGRLTGQAQQQQLALDAANEQRRYQNLMKFMAFQQGLMQQKRQMGMGLEQRGASNQMKGFGNIGVAATDVLSEFVEPTSKTKTEKVTAEGTTGQTATKTPLLGTKIPGFMEGVSGSENYGLQSFKID